MSKEVHVLFDGELQRFLLSRVGGNGLYDSASEYLRDLVRRDYDREEQKNWAFLRQELSAGLAADETEFVPLDLDEILLEARSGRQAHES